MNRSPTIASATDGLVCLEQKPRTASGWLSAVAADLYGTDAAGRTDFLTTYITTAIRRREHNREGSRDWSEILLYRLLDAPKRRPQNDGLHDEQCTTRLIQNDVRWNVWRHSLLSVDSKPNLLNVLKQPNWTRGRAYIFHKINSKSILTCNLIFCFIVFSAN